MEQPQRFIKVRTLDSCPKCVHRSFTLSDRWKVVLSGSVKCTNCKTTWGYEKFDNFKATMVGVIVFVFVLSYFEDYFPSKKYELVFVFIISTLSIFVNLYKDPKEKTVEPEVDWNDFFENLRKR